MTRSVVTGAVDRAPSTMDEPVLHVAAALTVNPGGVHPARAARVSLRSEHTCCISG